MPKRRLPHLQHERSRHGRMKWYVRLGRGSRIRIHGDYGSPEFIASYHAALRGGSAPAPLIKATANSLRWLIDQWRKSSDWASMSPATRRQRENILLHVLETAGKVPYIDVTAM